ncbi:TonB-dependent receptor [Polaribacter sp. MSW13]|uniref:TonB-dependent receptor n=1 Tax=Polaribacter marinus TaxID=2916838 RepID=A0A9X2AM44_9FLAO|nr:TonB-dependent receptor [Polaribacter marinus]MCI2229965.1 TonB-dependent receptor [Polaribacter marinus]
MQNNNFSKSLIIAFLFLFTQAISAQTIKGKVVNADGEGAPYINVLEKGTTNGVSTDENGSFSITVKQLPSTLVFSSLGFKSVEKKISDTKFFTITLEEDNVALDEVVLVGSRNKNRTVADTPVAIDIIDISELVSAGPQVSINDILNYVAPSFTSTTQTISDGTDHIDPAALRGLGPDQVLVLVNGKRRHNTSLVNVNSTVGRGSVGTDMNAIPSFAIKKIELLKDGAAAQYGSDAIAGVINIVLKDNQGFSIQANANANVGSETNNQRGGIDGEGFQIDANYGIPLSDKGGFINFTGSLSTREPSSRAGYEGFSGDIFNGANSVEWVGFNSGKGSDITQYSFSDIQFFAQGVTHFDLSLKNDIQNATSMSQLQSLLGLDTTDAELEARNLTRSDFNMRVGQSQLRSGQFFANMELPINDNFEVYAFGGMSYRNGNAGGFYRTPNQSRNYTGLYRAGFLPEINSDVKDKSAAIGIRGKQGDWDVDFSNTWGENSFGYNISNTVNATMLSSSPLSADAGGYSFSQNTTNLDVSRFYEDTFKGLNVAFGAEYRLENYQIMQGQEESWATYDINGNIWNGDASLQVTDFFGNARAGGIQVFPGFRPENERNAYRNNYSAYVDLEADFTDKWLVSGALRYENYSDFGSTLNWKLATLYKLTDNVNVRAAASTGFRAPSLQQQNFNATSTNFINGIPNEVGTFSNDSRIAKLLGIPQLKQEESFSTSLGLTAKFPDANITLTVDGYFIAIEDRVVLTGNFSRPTQAGELQSLFDQANATQARFFSNAIDTETKGLDINVSHRTHVLGNVSLTTDLAFAYSQTKKVDDVHASQQLASQIDTYFGERDQYFLEFATPRVKGSLSHSLKGEKWSMFLRNSFFGSVFNPDGLHEEFGSKVITDLSFGINVTEDLTFTFGSSNIFDVYPDKTPNNSNENLTSNNQFIYPRVTSQFGINGRTAFARLNLKL